MHRCYAPVLPALVLAVAFCAGCLDKSLGPVDRWTQKDFWSVRFFSPEFGLIVGTKGIIVRTTDGGSNWSVGDSITPYDLHSVGGSSGVVCISGVSGTILRIASGMQSWQLLTVSADYPPWLNGLSFADETTGVVVSESGDIFRTSDSGLTWAKCYTPQIPGTESSYGVTFANSDTAFTVGGSRIRRSTDRGLTWTSQTPHPSRYLLGISFGSSTSGVVVGSQGFVVRTTDGGESWVEKQSGVTEDLYAISFATATHGYAAGRFSTVLKTIDGGESWTALSSNGNRELLSIYAVAPGLAFAVGLKGTILRISGDNVTIVP